MDKNTRFILVAGGMIIVIGVLLRQQARAALQAAASFNEGTVFEDTGIVGTLGNITNVASGGLLERFGTFIGTTLADIREGFGGIVTERQVTPEDIREQIGVRAG